MDKKTAAKLKEVKHPNNHRYVTVYMGEAELKLIPVMMEKLGISRSELLRASLQSYAGTIAKILG